MMAKQRERKPQAPNLRPADIPALRNVIDIADGAAHRMQVASEHDVYRWQMSAALEPMDYRNQHDPLGEGAQVIVRFGMRVELEDGKIGTPHRVHDTLARLHQRGGLDDIELEAGREFQDDFERACYVTVKVPDPGRVPGQQSHGDMPQRVYDARRRVNEAIDALGGIGRPQASAAWHIIGLGETCKQFAEMRRFGSGRSICEKSARWLVIGACGILVKHYGKETTR